MKARFPRRRTLVKAGLFLLAGAVVNVGVAWACARWFIDSAWLPGEGNLRLEWPIARPVDWPAPQEAGPSLNSASHFDILPQFGAGFRYYSSIIEAPLGEPPSSVKNYAIADVRSGLPLRSMRYFHITEPAPPPSPNYAAIESSLIAGIATRRLDNTACGALPLRPIPLAFAANTAFYAAGLWSVLFAPGVVRRRRRRNRGLCPACGYDTAGLTDCPECGAAGKD